MSGKVKNNHYGAGIVQNMQTAQRNVQNKHDSELDRQLVFSFNRFRLNPICIDREFNNFYRDEDQFVDKISVFIGRALPLLSQECETLFMGREKTKAEALHLHKVTNKRAVIEDILKAYDYTQDEIDNIFEGEEVYQLEVPYINGATRVVFQRIENKISFLFMDPNHHVYFNDRIDEANRALFFEYCPINEEKQCSRMDYLHTCFAFEFLDEAKYESSWGSNFDPMTSIQE